MLVGVPKEIKRLEYRVALTQESVTEFTAAGHDIVETTAREGVELFDADYRAAGAVVASSANFVFEQAR